MTYTDNRGLMLEEPLLFEERCRRSLRRRPPRRAPAVAGRLDHLLRHREIGLPGLAEPDVVRHFTRLSRQNYAIDMGIFPLGSCTMKHNPRLNEKMARLPGFADIHPLQPVDTVQGALAVIDTLADWLKALTGMPARSRCRPRRARTASCAGCLRCAPRTSQRGDAARGRAGPRKSAHGTNPATAAFCGYRVENIPADARGRVDLAALQGPARTRRRGGDDHQPQHLRTV